MKLIIYGTAALLGITAFVILILAFSGKKPFRTLFLNAVIGICAVAAIKLTAKYTGVQIPINKFTVVGSAVFGLPSVIGFLVLKLIFL